MDTAQNLAPTKAQKKQSDLVGKISPKLWYDAARYQTKSRQYG